MQANPRSIDALFNSQLRYVVPMFQRLYVWQEEPQWRTLWEDIAEKAELQLCKIGSNPHYLGALIIEGVRPGSPREVKRFLVIDGQQRLTTLQLLLCAFRDIAKKNSWKTLDRATSRYLENSDTDVMERPDEERFKLWPTTLNRSIFSDIVAAGSIEAVESKHPIVRLPRKRKSEPRNALVDCYVYFYRQIEIWIAASVLTHPRADEDAALSLLQALQQDFSVVEIALSEGDDSQEIFYSLNSQGRPLSQSDLLRSLIFMRAEKEKQDRDAIFSEYWSRYETYFWNVEIKRAGRSYSRLDLGLRYFLMARTGNLIDARRVNEEYRRWISSIPAPYSSVRDELADFSRYTQLYERSEQVNTGISGTDFWRILRDFDVSTALPLLMFLELGAGLSKDQLSSAHALIESFIARRVIVGEENKEYNKFFVEIIGEINALPSIEVVPALAKKLLSGGGTTRSWPTDEQVIECAVSRSLGRELQTPALRLILERLELAQRGKKSEDHSIPDGLQIEHVLPQKWATHWPLSGTLIPENMAAYPILAIAEFMPFGEAIRMRNAKLQTLGNLTLLNKYLNPAASNGSFDLKKSEYTHSVLRLNRYFDQLPLWDEDGITERSKKLGKLLCHIWPRAASPV